MIKCIAYGHTTQVEPAVLLQLCSHVHILPLLHKACTFQFAFLSHALLFISFSAAKCLQITQTAPAGNLPVIYI